MASLVCVIRASRSRAAAQPELLRPQAAEERCSEKCARRVKQRPERDEGGDDISAVSVRVKQKEKVKVLSARSMFSSHVCELQGLVHRLFLAVHHLRFMDAAANG